MLDELVVRGDSIDGTLTVHGEVAMVIVTTEAVAGYRIGRSLEIVWGEGHNRGQALEALKQAALALGANGVTGARWGPGSYPGMPWREGPYGGPGDVPLHFVYGTAVVLHAIETAE
jgi:uncharacterized protein YbjQ (UPF0145 family)